MTAPEQKPLHVRVAEALGDKPRRSWSVMNRAEKGVFIDFETKWEADADVADHAQRYPAGLYAEEGAHVVERQHFPKYDTDWSATGPLIERFSIALRPPNEPERIGGEYWEAYAWVYPAGWDGKGYHNVEEITKGDRSALVAVCKLLLALSEAGKLPHP